jgi:hypothetical protein
MTNDFSAEVAEEVMMASRAFMRRLSTELPRGLPHVRRSKKTSDPT